MDGQCCVLHFSSHSPASAFVTTTVGSVLFLTVSSLVARYFSLDQVYNIQTLRLLTMQAPQTSLSDLLPPLHRRLADIQSYQLPRLSTFSGPSDMHSELVDELRTDLESIRHQLGIAKELSLYAPQQTETQEVEGIEREYIRWVILFLIDVIDS